MSIQMTIAFSVAFTSPVRVAMILLITMVSGRHSCSARCGGECCGSCHHRVVVGMGMAMVVMVAVAVVLGHRSILLFLVTAMKYSREDRSYENQHLPCLHDQVQTILRRPKLHDQTWHHLITIREMSTLS